MKSPRQIALPHAGHVPAPARSGARARWLALALLAAPIITQASQHTEELFNEAMDAVPAPLQGAKLYQRFCMECHGSSAFGDVEKTIPSLAGQVERYVVKQLVDFTELDRDTPEMHRLMARPELGQPQAWRDVAAYLVNLRPNPRPQAGSGRDLEHGARSYKAYCASCHGASGEGLEAAPVPALRGQHYSYLLLQLKSFEADRRSNVDGPLVEHMVGLSRADMDAIADYLSRLPSNPRRETVSTLEPRRSVQPSCTPACFSASKRSG
jgi:cytochrome c553